MSSETKILEIPSGEKITLSGYDIEHLLWLAARDIVFFSTFDGSKETWDDYWHAYILISDTFYYIIENHFCINTYKKI